MIIKSYWLPFYIVALFLRHPYGRVDKKRPANYQNSTDVELLNNLPTLIQYEDEILDFYEQNDDVIEAWHASLLRVITTNLFMFYLHNVHNVYKNKNRSRHALVAKVDRRYQESVESNNKNNKNNKNKTIFFWYLVKRWFDHMDDSICSAQDANRLVDGLLQCVGDDFDAANFQFSRFVYRGGEYRGLSSAPHQGDPSSMNKAGNILDLTGSDSDTDMTDMDDGTNPNTFYSTILQKANDSKMEYYQLGDLLAVMMNHASKTSQDGISIHPVVKDHIYDTAFFILNLSSYLSSSSSLSDISDIINTTEEFSPGTNQTLKIQSIQTVKDLDWLNDEVINSYLYMANNGMVLNPDTKCMLLDSYFYQKVVTNDTNGFLRYRKHDMVHLFDPTRTERLLFPIHFDVHWALCEVDLLNNTVSIYDSIQNNNRSKTTATNVIERYLKGMEKKLNQVPRAWQFIPVDCPQQTNGSDCGVFTILFGVSRMRNQSVAFIRQRDMPKYRVRIPIDFLMQQVHIIDGMY